MARTVVPPQPAILRAKGAAEGVDKPAKTGDSLPERLVKYIPGETLAFFIPAVAAIGSDRQALLIAVLVIAAIGTEIYLLYRGLSQPDDERPNIHFYVLALIAFVCWAFGTAPSVAALIGADDLLQGIILGGAVFLIPIVDGVLNLWILKRRQS